MADDFSQFLMGSGKSAPSPTNVGNIRPVGSSTGFQQYATPEEGIKAIDENLKAYGTKHKINTLRGVISRWAPPSENDTDSYINFVSQKTGIKPDEEIDLTNPVIRHIISGPIVLQEQGLKKIKGEVQPSTQQVAEQPTEQPKDDFSSFLSGETKASEVKTEQVKPTEKTKPFFDKSRNESTINAYDIIPGAPLYEAALHGITGTGAQLAGNVIGAVKHYGERGTAAEEEAAKIAEQYTYQPRGQIIKKVLPAVTEKVAGAIEESKLAPLLMQPELLGASEFVKPIAKQTGVGRAAESLKEQFGRKITMPEEGKPAFQGFKSQVSDDVLHDLRLKKASELPVPVELTAGQAAQDPILISRERNERGFKDQHTQRFNEQNKALQENAQIIKQNVAPNVLTENYVADAENLIDSVKAIKEANKAKTQEAYKALEDAAGGKFPIDGKKFANNAISKLTSEDRLDYLPSTIRNKLDSYASGSKEMNFNLFENLRSDLAAEMRKADRAGDGNMKHVLSVVRDQLENLPMQEGDAALKGLADNARKTAKADFDLEKSNPLYNKVLNESADSKDFIQKFVMMSKNADFMKSIDLLKNDPVALEHLRSGTMDYIIRESTDASNNFSNAKFNKLIENLNVNKKLDALFGEHSQQLQDLAEVAQIVEARPRGSYVSSSDTATALGSMAKQYGGELIKGLPVVGRVVEPAARILEERKIKKEIKKSLNPKPKTKLSDIGK
jgi:hypothetical protein